jgi:hypothetical protein
MGANQAYSTLAVSSTAVQVPAAFRTNKIDFLSITVETDQVRFRLDGSAPTASEGHLLEAGDILELHDAAEISGAQFIRVTTDATLKISGGRSKVLK